MVLRNPARTILLIPADTDGTVVYVKEVKPGEAVISIKQGLAATVKGELLLDRPNLCTIC
jgi:hypothetical protein